ncbi:thiol reductant ABC exporter subunit CydD [Modicisalibacter tunisiensis]|uniref:Thiol reductant ABC exporter subunit CydD n=1 Tax=Modicisalibacter tunisiensis TaxID=390637 RepID=A0ABS7X0C1_9GAMM|nr:thiol reductant ABC exporter subunit CydD [Modicisalibacter tunisiensis]MBZ9568332.1 thiol reductant ABC exporter subunit CydD [Modicisalibacter tunisiensis]
MLADDTTPRAWLAELAGRVRGWLWLTGAAGLAAGLCTVVQMGLLAWLVDQLVTRSRDPAELAPVFGLLLGVLALRAVAQWAQERAAFEAGYRVRERVREQLLDHLVALGPVGLGDRHTAGLGQQWVEQVEALDGYFARFLPQLGLVMALPLVILAVVAWLDWLAALLLLASAPLIPLFMALVGMGAERLNREQFESVTRLAGHFLDRVRGIATLQLFNRARESTREVYVAADDYRRRSLRTLRLAFLSSAVLEFFASVAIAVVAIYIGFGLLGYIAFGPADSLTLFSGLLILLLAPEFFQPLRTLSQHYHDRAAALGAADGLVALLKEPAAAPFRPAPADREAPRITLRGVTLRHRGRDARLGPFGLSVAPGECVALVGPSGSGKSSLLQLLGGFLAPEGGEATITPRGPLAWMDQRPWLVQGSLADNLRLAAPAADEAALWQALCEVHLEALVAGLPAGLDTPLGERGVGLSGGQAQRLALARVFLAEAPLLLLDEPTAGLDADTEAAVIEALQRLMQRGATVVIATHQPALCAAADRVVELNVSGASREVADV